ncbi:cyclin-dependent kinase 11B-like isoform X3 [Belonocnema kinseyi]|uniref:cyclin-dependent kinase 11B-like isoform X3 n=1 Tax=Belonocnema kinseyi TaxID=2817044 RepID=UPI00143CC370|nr:cyclin-dependent kinase 11B-like isoform X3 [Belonocnema kinseyi]
MGDSRYEMEVDNQSEDGEIKKSPKKDPENFSFSEEEGADTTDSLDIKPPQAVIRHHKVNAPRRRDKHSERRDRKEDKERKSRHHDRGEERHRDKHRHRRHEMESLDRGERSDGSKRERERVDRIERIDSHSRDSSRHERKERNTGDRVLEDLRERLLDKRRERREDPREARESRREARLEEAREIREPRDRRDARMEEIRERHELRPDDGRERRDIRTDDRRHIRMIEEQYAEPEMIDRPEKRHKRSHKHDRVRDRDREKMDRENSHRDKHMRLMDMGNNEEDDVEVTEIPMLSKDPKEMTEQELRRERRSSEERRSNRHSSDSSESSSDDDDDEDDDDDSNESNKGSNDDSNEASDYNNPSPLSVERLAKSDHSEGGSPGHVDSNGAAKGEETEEKVTQVPELPPYLPAIQGCRSVEEFQCLNRIEEGTYGVVYRARDKRTEEIVALKRLKMEKEKEGFPITSLREINTLLKAQHPNIVTVREIVVGSNMDKIFIVMDYVEHDLKSLMETMKKKRQAFIPGEVKCLMQQLLRAVAHLHDNWILHRDLKTSNLLLSHRGVLKVGDFGLAREYGSPLRHYTPIVVTLWYRAPELLLGGKEYSTPIDMWSVGCIFAEFLSMEALFPGQSDQDQINRIFKELGTPNDRIWPGFSKMPLASKTVFSHYPVNNLRQRCRSSDLGIELLNKFLTYDPQQRVTAEDALKHSFFTEAPLPIDPKMFPTWPAKSELGVRTANNASPKPPSGGKEYKQLGDGDDVDINSSGFHMGLMEGSKPPQSGGGFHLKF